MREPTRRKIAIYIRLSRETMESASIETQRNAAQEWLRHNGYNPADAEEYVDAGVSGARPLEDRKDMRRLMSDRPEVIVAWKLDRYARNVSEFLRLIAWGEAHGTRVATTDNAINTASPTGRMIAVVLAALAEWERSLIAGRVLDGQATRRAQGRWVAGRSPYGFRVERRDGAAYLVQYEPEVKLIRAAIEKLLTDGSVTSTAPMVNLGERQWRRMLTSGILRGWYRYKGELIMSEDGITPLQFVEPVINAAEDRRIRERMLALGSGVVRARRMSTPLITGGLGVCFRCHKNIFGGIRHDNEPRYRCQRGCVTIRMATLDERVEAEFLQRWGGFQEYTVRLEGGNDLSAQMIEAQERAERLTERMASAGPLMLASLEKHAEELEAAYADLRAAHDPEVREVLVPTGKTLGAAWKAADKPGRTQLLKDVGLRVVLHPRQAQDRMAISWASGGDDHELVELLGDLE